MAKIYELPQLESEAPRIFGVKTGTKLDYMFHVVDFAEEEGKPIIRKLGGLPYLSVFNVVGVPDTGKSVLAEQFAVYQASLGYRSVFVSTETPATFIYNNIRSRAYALGINFEEVKENFLIIDVTEDEEVRKDHRKLFPLLEEGIRKKRATITIIDSITGLYENKELYARTVVRDIYNKLKSLRQTALLISQKRSSQASESSEAAGGLAVAHIVDGTIVLDKKVILSKYEENLYGVPLGDVLRTIRIDGCRVAGHDTATYKMTITPLGLIKIEEPLYTLSRKK